MRLGLGEGKGMGTGDKGLDERVINARVEMLRRKCKRFSATEIQAMREKARKRT
jgi:hypothetical protein